MASLEEAVTPGLTEAARLRSYTWVCGAHAALSASMGLCDAEYAPVASLLEDLRRLLDGIHLTGEVSPKLRARVAAFGELLSSQLGVAFLRRAGLRVTRVDSRQLLTSGGGSSGGGGGVGASSPGGAAPPPPPPPPPSPVISTTALSDRYLEADVRPSAQPERADAAAGGAEVVICQGFIASTPEGATCLLGRGGSDTSAALFAALVGATRLEIWTDVNGMFTADPRFVPRSRLIRNLTYREAQELAAMGAKVLHPRCLLPAAFGRVPVQVRNTMDPGDDAEITTVSASGTEGWRGGEGGRGAAVAPVGPRGAAVAPISRLNTPFKGGEPRNGEELPFAAAAAAVGDAPPVLALPSGSITPPQITVYRSGSPSRAGSPSSTGGNPSTPPTLPFSVSPRLAGLSGAAREEGGAPGGGTCKVLAVARRKGVTLLSMSAYDMWGNAGFLGRVFSPFGAHGVSVDLIATSQYAVSVTLDHIPDGLVGEPFKRLTGELSALCTTTVRHPCAVVSVVGRALRNGLPQLGAAMAVLRGVPVHMVSEAAEDLNMSFVVDEEFADKLVADLHRALLEAPDMDSDAQFGPVWAEISRGKVIPGEAKH